MSVWWRPCLEQLGKCMSSSICVSSHTHTPQRLRLEQNKRSCRNDGRTNALDFNKELSQRRVWLYISDAEVIWDPPAGPELSHGPMGLKTLNGEKKKKERQAARKEERNLQSRTTVACTPGKRLQPWSEPFRKRLHCIVIPDPQNKTITLYLFHLLHGPCMYSICCMAHRSC